eukprot:769526-Amphidinium_carterae.1
MTFDELLTTGAPSKLFSELSCVWAEREHAKAVVHRSLAVSATGPRQTAQHITADLYGARAEVMKAAYITVVSSGELVKRVSARVPVASGEESVDMVIVEKTRGVLDKS